MIYMQPGSYTRHSLNQIIYWEIQLGNDMSLFTYICITGSICHYGVEVKNNDTLVWVWWLLNSLSLDYIHSLKTVSSKLFLSKFWNIDFSRAYVIHVVHTLFELLWMVPHNGGTVNESQLLNHLKCKHLAHLEGYI